MCHVHQFRGDSTGTKNLKIILQCFLYIRPCIIYNNIELLAIFFVFFRFRNLNMASRQLGCVVCGGSIRLKRYTITRSRRMRSVLENIRARRLEQKRGSLVNLSYLSTREQIQIQDLICNSCYHAFKRVDPEERARPAAPEEVIEDEEPQAGPSHATQQERELAQMRRVGQAPKLA